jgi:hypothetical protein
MSRVVVDRNLITAQGYAFVDFAIAICDYLKIFESESQKEDQMGKIYKVKNDGYYFIESIKKNNTRRARITIE